jgi:hypothetical protein
MAQLALGGCAAFAAVVTLLSCSRSDEGGINGSTANRARAERRPAALTEPLHEPVALTSETTLPFPSAVAIDAGSLYWLNYDARTLNRIPKTGGPAQVVAATRSEPRLLQLDGSHAYWAENLPELRAGDRRGAIMRVSTDGGEPSELAHIDGEITGLALDAAAVYFSTWSAVLRAPKTGGAPVQLASTQWAFALVADQQDVYVADYRAETILRIPKTNGAVEMLADHQAGPRSLAADDTYLYWVTYAKHLMRLRKAGGTPELLFDGAGVYDACTSSVAVETSYLYLTTCCDAGSYAGELIRLPRGGGTPVVLAKGIYKPCNPVTDDTSVYWSTTTSATAHTLLPGGAILKIDK